MKAIFNLNTLTTANRKLQGNLSYFYRVYISKRKSFSVFSIEETIEKIIHSRCSLIRYGDGEMAVMRGKSIKFQTNNDLLAQALISYAKMDKNDLLICIPDVFNKLDSYTAKSRDFWKTNLVITRRYWEIFFDLNRKYYNAFLSRPYISYSDKSMMKTRFDHIRSIWQNRKVLLIEGSTTRNGVVTGLFDNADSVQRIICPSTHAFSSIDQILAEAIMIPKDCLVLVTLGPAAKFIVYRLYSEGFQALDIGQIDTEYKWYLTSSHIKWEVPESAMKAIFENTSSDKEIEDKYSKQIITRIEP